MNLKKLFASTLTVLMIATLFPVNVLKAGYSSELEGAYDYAFEKGSTTMDSIENANVYGQLIRSHMAKMLSAWATEVLGLTPDTSKTCEFTDIENQTEEMQGYIVEACQLGLMGVGISEFRPNDKVTRAEFGTVLSRALRGDKYNGGTPYYADHLAALEDAEIMTDISNPSMNEVRGYVRLMMQRADDKGVATPSTCKDPMVQIACALNQEDDACPVECRDTEDEEPAYEVAGNLSIDLDNSTPDSLKLPKGAQGVEVAVFEVTADEDIDLFSATLERVGMGSSTAVEDVALFTEEGRVSKAKSFNSDDEAVVTFSPALTIKKGETVLLKAVVSTKAGASVGDEFALALTAMDTTAEDVDADYPITASTMEIGSVTATPVVVAMDGSVSALKVGETDAEVLKFKVTNNTTTKENVELSSITFKENGSIDEEDELSNFTLRFDGEEVATTKNANDKYVTFNLDDAVVIEEGKTEKFVVTADIDGGAAKTVQLYIDKTLDVMATADKYGFVSITNNVTTTLSTAVNVEAGELSIVTTEPSMTEIRKDKDNIVIGEIKFVANAGKTLELDDFALKLEVDTVPTTNTQELLAIFENVELYNASAGGVYDLACTETSAAPASINAADKLTCGDTDMDIALKDGGTTTFQIRLDTTNTAISPAALKFHVDVDVAGAVKVRETTDDNLVTDVTPSALSYKSITLQDSSAVVTSLTLASAKSAVIGSEGVVLHKFEIEAGDSSDIEVDEIKLQGTVVDNAPAGTAGFNNTRVNSVKLYKNEVTNANLLDTVGGSQIASNVATFDGFKVIVKKGEKVTFYATVDVINDVNQATDTITASVTSVSAEDTDNDDVTVTGTPAASTTTLTIRGVGTLNVVADNTDPSTNKAKNVLGGTTSDFVASYEFTATNEGVLVKDLTLTQTNGGVDLQAAVSEVIIYANDKTTELARESVSSDTVTFDNIDFVVEEGNENVYVKVVASKIGKDQAGVQTVDFDLALTVTDADGAESDKVVTLPGVTADSNAFSVLPVRISNIAFVSSFGGETVASNLTNGENVIGIIAVTTDSSTNTNTTNGSSLKTELESMEVSVSTDIAAAGITAFTVEKINGTVGAQTIATLAGGAYTPGVTNPAGGINLFRGVALGADEEVENGTTVYYVVKATVSGLAAASNKYIQLKLNDLDTAATATVEYSSNNSDDNETYDNTDNVASLRIGVTSLNAASISSNY